MAIYGISDIHLSLGTVNKEMDVFGEKWENHTEKIFKNWQATITDNDTVVIAGDVSWSMGLVNSRADLGFIHGLKGRKIILRGNHDYWWATKQKMDKFISECGYSSIEFLHNNAIECEGTAIAGTRGWLIPNDGNDEDVKIFEREKIRLELSLAYSEKLQNVSDLIVFIHYPPVVIGNDNMQLPEIMKKFNVKECYFGHTHSVNTLPPKILDIKMRLLSCDYLDFTPLLIKS